MQYWPKTELQKKQALAFAAGEAASYFSAPGTLVFCEDVLPNQMDAIKRGLSTSIIEPNLKFFEKASGMFGSKKKTSDVPENPALVDPKKRAYDIADTMVKFGVSNFIGGTAVSLLLQTGAEKMLGITNLPTTEKFSMRFTETAGHYGSALILGTIFSPFADRAKEVVSKILNNIGVSKKDADNIGFASVYTVIPEVVGTVIGWLTMIRGMNKGSIQRL